MKTKFHRFFIRIFLISSLFVLESAYASSDYNQKHVPADVVKILPAPSVQDLKSNFMSASGTLLISDNDSRMIANCSTFTFAKNGKKYLFLTAGHCVSNYNKETKKTTPRNAIFIVVLEKKDGTRSYYPAEIVESEEKGLAIGEEKDFEDFAVLETEINEDIPIMPLADSDPKLDEDVRVAAVPFGLENFGLLFLRGYVSKEKINNITTQEGVSLNGGFGIQVIGLGPIGGFSGGGVLSVERGAIIGIMVIYTANKSNHVTFVIAPITKFNSFYKEYNAGQRNLTKPKQIKLKKGE